MSRWVTCIACMALCVLIVGCQNKQAAHRPADPAGDLQRAQAQPVQTPIPSTVGNQPIVLTELSPNDAAALSDGMMDQKTQTKPAPPKPKPQVVITEPDQSNTSPTIPAPQPVQTPQKPKRINKEPSDIAFARRVEKAHGKWYWRSTRCVQADIKIVFGKKVVLEGKILTDRHAKKVRLTLTNGTVLVYDGKKVWMSPADASMAKPRFDARMWASFLTMPFKLNEVGSHLKNMGTLQMGNNPLPAAKLTPAPEVAPGTAPGTACIVYVDPKTNWLRAMAYDLTGATDVNQTGHAITYDNYANVAGVILPRTWKFWNWSLEQGPTGQPLGYANLTHLQMVYPAPHSFTKPADAVLCEAPH